MSGDNASRAPRTPANRPDWAVSILMPARNEGEKLRKTVESIFENTYYPNFELVLIDDASSDASFEFIAKGPLGTDPRVRILRNLERQGCLQSWIQAASVAEGEVLKFLDAHHSFSPYWLSNLIDALARRDFNALIGPVVGVLDENSWRPTNALSYGWGIDPDLTKAWHLGREEVGIDGRVPWLSGHQITLHRRIYMEIGGFCPLFQGHGSDDLDLCLRAFRHGYACYIEPTALIGHLYKDHFLEPVTWEQMAFNHYLLVYLNLGSTAMERHLDTLEHGQAGGQQEFQRQIREISGYYDRYVRDAPRSAAALKRALHTARRIPVPG